MRAIDRKLLRDLWRLRWQAAAIVLLVGCGVAVAVMASSARAALVIAQDRYYAQTHFADVFATATRAPRFVIDELAAIPGVVAVDARAVKAGLMEVAGSPRPATARLLALPDSDAAALNGLVVMAGRLPAVNSTNEVAALKTFLDAAHVPLGATQAMVIDGRRMTFRIVGAVLSPEFVYLPTSTSALPDDAHMGIFWAPRTTAERATGLGGAFSSVALTLAPGTSVQSVLPAVDRVLAPYGGRPSIARADQVSNKFQVDRIERFRIIAVVLPPVFLVVSAALVHIVLGRMVDAEREQIGLLKAFGYSNLQAAANYLKIAALIGAIGVVAGGVAGDYVGRVITVEIGMFMRFPRLDAQFSWTALAVSGAFSVAAAVSGSLAAVGRAVRLSPAVAMQPLAPTVYRRSLLERLPFWTALDQPTRIILRNLQRFPVRAGLTTGGFAVSLSLLVGSQFMFGSMDAIVQQAYFQARRWTELVGFVTSRERHAVTELAQLPGVVAVEPARVVPVDISAGGRTERSILTGIDRGARLVRMLDPGGRELPFVGDGIVMSDALADRLGVRAGDEVDLEITDGRRPRIRRTVTAVARDYAGRSTFIARDALNRVMADGDVASGATLLVADDRRADFYRAVERTPAVAAVGSRTDTVRQWHETVAQTMDIEMTFFMGFAGAIALGVAYNMCRVALAERARDLATLRVLGFAPRDCAYILLGEVLVLALVAAPLGILGGIGLAEAMVIAFSHQDLKLPLVIASSGYGICLLTYLGVLAVAAVPVARRVWTLDLVRVLKTRE